MSYSFTVIKKDGELTLGNIPDGSFPVSGHYDADGGCESLTVFRTDEQGKIVVQASAWHE